ncbi:hypothetical protein J2Y45_003372 [Dyadobacter sp. BE34]|uniref:DUF5683 domain-containing protein n=1 Tax=Dyadobacter fermentans TaxID=94254 RepID=A0ABU1QZM8_9BACT|nr:MULTISPECIES: DUF5683 domain-containing protein [Dyadobacter]MDR6806180.1 hypothetical protein [Dyadobacter fermentans]MDR7043921.1 hypothetical protein [Dyadobacter sp. BE242]MDR7198232.1 hypothetical protein [Dyadobacter sp. BE34]MDR7216195.1 hypothetical protein [Dyadobacter sp. BE31]MDR7264279.1 hypothetical protein [Dyadobacter sp. BE32]
MKNWVLLGLILLVSSRISAQTEGKKDSLKTEKLPAVALDSTTLAQADSLKNVKKKWMPVPKTATKLALIPGAGQIYNRDYWKAPIVYLAFGGGLYTYYLNTIKYHDFLDAYKSFYVLDKSDPNYGKRKKELASDDATVNVRVRNLLNTSSEYRDATHSQIVRQKNYWRRNRGFAIIVTGLIYTLSIIEANVAAHLKTFDLSDDLSLNISPKLNQPAMQTPTPGLRMVFNFK